MISWEQRLIGVLIEQRAKHFGIVLSTDLIISENGRFWSGLKALDSVLIKIDLSFHPALPPQNYFLTKLHANTFEEESPETTPVKSWTPLDPWWCAVVSGTKMLAADSLSPVSCEVGPPCIRLVCPAHPTNAWLDWDLGEFGGQVNTWNLLFCSSNHSSNIFALWHGALSCWMWPQPSGNAVSMKGGIWSATMLR